MIPRGAGACPKCRGFVREGYGVLECINCGLEVGQLRPGARPTAALQRTWAQIAKDAAQAERVRATHCKRGHPFTLANTYVDKHGWRQCRACARMMAAKRREKALTEAGG